MANVRELEPWKDVRLRCGIGHMYRGRVRIIQLAGHDMDGDILWYPPEKDFAPSTCVVCGLKTWAIDE